VSCVLEALYPAGEPLFAYAAAMALDALSDTPGRNTAGFDDEERFAPSQEETAKADADAEAWMEANLPHAKQEASHG